MTRILARESTSNLRRSQAPIMVIIGNLAPESPAASWAAQLTGLGGTSRSLANEAALPPFQPAHLTTQESPITLISTDAEYAASVVNKVGHSVHMFTELSVHMFTETDLPAWWQSVMSPLKIARPMQSMIYWPFGHSAESFKFNSNRPRRQS